VLSCQCSCETVLAIVDAFDLKSFRLKVFREHAAHLNIIIDHKLHNVRSYGWIARYANRTIKIRKDYVNVLYKCRSDCTRISTKSPRSSAIAKLCNREAGRIPPRDIVS
jgi:hypothetical protein